MHSPSVFAAFTLALGFFSSGSSASPWPSNTLARRNVNLTNEQIEHELRPRLSESALIYGAENPRWENATERWQWYEHPTINLVIEAGVEEDVSEIVKYANSQHVPFLAVNTGHGSTKTLGAFDGIQISLNQLRKIEIQPNGTSVVLGGGVYVGQVVQDLWEKGYVTSTGSCECVSLLGPGLGGGHGRLQGLYGMVSDGFISLNVVLADGNLIKVSENSHSDLFWAMRGAGHNFGIVTSFEAHIHPRKVDTWFSKIYTFSEDKLERFTELLNELTDIQPPELIHWTLYLNDPASFNDPGSINGSGSINANSTKPIISWAFEYIGSEEEAQPYYAPFDELGPISSNAVDIPYPEIFVREGNSETDPICDGGIQHMQFEAGLVRYNVTAQRAIYNLFAEKVKHDPALATSFVVMEGYSTQGVDAVESSSTAYPLRDDKILVAVMIQYAPDPSLDAFAIEWGDQTRDLWNAGQPGRLPTAYTNYAFGDESLQEIYGYEPWRLESLRGLKQKYDPKERFNYYNPIPAWN